MGTECHDRIFVAQEITQPRCISNFCQSHGNMFVFDLKDTVLQAVVCREVYESRSNACCGTNNNNNVTTTASRSAGQKTPIVIEIEAVKWIRFEVVRSSNKQDRNIFCHAHLPLKRQPPR